MGSHSRAGSGQALVELVIVCSCATLVLFFSLEIGLRLQRGFKHHYVDGGSKNSVRIPYETSYRFETSYQRELTVLIQKANDEFLLARKEAK